MRPVSFIASALSVFVAAVVAIGWTGSAEIITVRSVEAVPLFDPDTLAGKIGDLPKQVGLLKVGEELPVVACFDRKSDINLHATYQGREVAVGEWREKVQLLRRDAYPWQVGAITSCRGFFESISTHA
jgi:hypothetical protein